MIRAERLLVYRCSHFDAVTVASKAACAPMPSALGEKRRTKTEFRYSTPLAYPVFSVLSKHRAG